MLTVEQLNEDQLQSYMQMVGEAGMEPRQALDMIDEVCIKGNHTGLRVTRFKLTESGMKEARALLAEVEED